MKGIIGYTLEKSPLQIEVKYIPQIIKFWRGISWTDEDKSIVLVPEMSIADMFLQLNCESCGKEFRSKYNLIQHIRMHHDN